LKDNVARVNIPIAIASLAISIMIFWMVLPERLSKRLRPIRVALSVEGLDAKHFYIAKQPASIVVRAEVTDEEYKAFSAEATAMAELYGAEAGMHLYPVSISPRGLRNIVTSGPPEAQFTLEALKSREVPVIIARSGTLIDPTEIVDSVKPDPKKATIDGPADDVAKVVCARATLRLDMLDGHSTQQLVQLEPVDSHNQVVNNVEVHPLQEVVTLQFSLTPQQKQVFVEALFADGQVPAGYVVKSYSVEPSHVFASGSSQSLSKIAKVSTEKIDISKMTYTQTVTAQLNRVADDVVLSPNVVQITIVIEPVTLKGLSPGSSPASPTGATKAGGSSSKFSSKGL